MNRLPQRVVAVAVERIVLHHQLDGAGALGFVLRENRLVLQVRLAASGALEKASVIKLPMASYLHDFTATARHLVIVLQPWIQDSFRLPFVDSLTWRPELGTQVLVLEKDDLTKRRIFELPAFSFFHLGDAWEESDGTIRFDGCIERDPTFGQRGAKALIAGQYVHSPKPVLAQFVLHARGKAELLPTRTFAEFPSNDKRRAGRPRQLTAHVTGYDSAGPFPHALGLWDWHKGKDDAFDFGKRQLVEEFLFVPRGSGEREGWLVGNTLNLDAKATELHLLDAAHVANGPIATWRTSMPLPLGFHGTFQG